MRTSLILSCLLLSMSAFAQVKSEFLRYNNLTEVEGTEYMIASITNSTKISGNRSNDNFLLFIDTNTGEKRRVDFPGDGYLGRLSQVKIDSLAINYLFVEARTVDLNDKKGIDWSDPTQLFVLSPNGLEKYQVTETNYHLRSWKVNQTTGKIVITGYTDENRNGKFDAGDRNEIMIVDLKYLGIKH